MMKTLFSKFLKPAPHQPEMKAEEIPSSYRYWRIHILSTIFIGYAAYYFTRGTLSLVMPELKKMGYDEVALGWIVTIFQLTYGFSKFGSGIIADQSNPRYFMGVGLILTGICNIVFGMVPSVLFMAVIWGLNGVFQGWGSAPCHRILTHWYSQSERGRWWGFWNTSHNVGAALLPLAATALMSLYGWKAGMIAPGILAILMGIFLMVFLRDTPQSLGLPAIEVYNNDYSLNGKAELKNERELTTKEILFTYILNNKLIWALAISYFLVYITRWSLAQWAFHYFVDAKGFEKWMAAKCIFWFEIGGLVGSLMAGTLSDLLFRGRRGPINAIFAGLTAPACFLLWKLTSGTIDTGSSSQMLLIQGLMGLTGFMVFGPQMLIAVAAAELSHKKAAATAVGFLGVIAYIGCSVTGGPLGHVIKNFGWDAYFQIIIGSSFLAMLCLLPFWNIRSKKDVK